LYLALIKIPSKVKFSRAIFVIALILGEHRGTFGFPFDRRAKGDALVNGCSRAPLAEEGARAPGSPLYG